MFPIVFAVTDQLKEFQSNNTVLEYTKVNRIVPVDDSELNS